MEVREFTDPVEFRHFADPLLLADEARNSLIIGVSGILIDRPEAYDGFRLWCVHDGNEPLLAALVRPPRNLILSNARSEAAAEALIHGLAEIEFPGLVGNEPHSGRIARALSAKPLRAMAQGLFRLDRVVDMGDAPGKARPASKGDHDVLVEWLTAFVGESLPDPDISEVEAMVASRLRTPTMTNGFWIWVDGGVPVSVSGYQRPTPTGMTIGPVYTPPEHRRQGYATSLVAQLTQWLLGQGKEACFLYTDLANPTSNSIYERIGYRQVAESSEYHFNTDPARDEQVLFPVPEL